VTDTAEMIKNQPRRDGAVPYLIDEAMRSDHAVLIGIPEQGVPILVLTTGPEPAPIISTMDLLDEPIGYGCSLRRHRLMRFTPGIRRLGMAEATYATARPTPTR
jgi:hypothetical protein